MKAKSLTYQELIALAKKHYNEGGDGIVECWTEATFTEYVNQFGAIDHKTAMMLIRL